MAAILPHGQEKGEKAMDGMFLNATTRAYEKYLQTLQPGHIKNDSKTARALTGKKGFDENRFRFGDFRKTLDTASASKATSSTKASTVKGTNTAEKTSGGGNVANLNRVSTEKMTMAQYKDYIRGKINALPVHSSQAFNSVSVDITEEGFGAMKSDPEYEAWVLDRLGMDFAYNDPWSSFSGGRYVVHHFGATKEEYTGQSWSLDNGVGKRLFEADAKKSFWQKRSDSIQSYLEAQELINLQQRRMERIGSGLGAYPTGIYNMNLLQNLRRFM